MVAKISAPGFQIGTPTGCLASLAGKRNVPVKQQQHHELCFFATFQHRVEISSAFYDRFCPYSFIYNRKLKFRT